MEVLTECGQILEYPWDIVFAAKEIQHLLLACFLGILAPSLKTRGKESEQLSWSSLCL